MKSLKPISGSPSFQDDSAGEKDASDNKKKMPLSQLDLSRWREYEDIVTDSLWLIPERDRSGVHLADYHGNFVPQIAYQAIRRFTRPLDTVLDGFLGSGTTLIECRRLQRHGIGLELKPELASQARDRIESQPNPGNVQTRVLVADSSNRDIAEPSIKASLKEIDKTQAQLVILHPPYHSIIRFSERPEDLSNCPSVDEFRLKFGKVVDTLAPFLELEHYLVLVIGDMYSDGEWVPLGFYSMNEVMRRGFRLKSIVVKDMQGNRAKRNLENIWRYRALAGGFYIFKHEYVMFFKKG